MHHHLAAPDYLSNILEQFLFSQLCFIPLHLTILRRAENVIAFAACSTNFRRIFRELEAICASRNEPEWSSGNPEWGFGQVNTELRVMARRGATADDFARLRHRLLFYGAAGA